MEWNDERVIRMQVIKDIWLFLFTFLFIFILFQFNLNLFLFYFCELFVIIISYLAIFI